ncbi:MAG: nickel-responsive transcriptional regulator NikR [Rhodospirillales bacterium]|nr:nickel-responsive transcriptional regulator NikR [Rhodospirillales bacterium]
MIERFTISIDPELMAAFDAFITQKGYENRSEAVRDLIREELSAQRLEEAESAGQVVACLSYVYNHDERRLASRLVDAQHRLHHMSRATMHVHLDSHECMEVMILEGAAAEVRRFADDVIAERGVRHGQANLVPLRPVRDHGSHTHGEPAARP